jgi:hypothetical protein
LADFGIFFHHKKAFFGETEKGYFDVKFYVVLESDFYFELLVQIFFTTAIFPENEPKIYTFLAITFVKMKISNC